MAPSSDPYGCISDTQYEFRHSSDTGKKTWAIVIGMGFRRDKNIDQLDPPREPNHPYPAGQQAERQQLPHEYIDDLRRINHLRHTAYNETALENINLQKHIGLGLDN